MEGRKTESWRDDGGGLNFCAKILIAIYTISPLTHLAGVPTPLKLNLRKIDVRTVERNGMKAKERSRKIQQKKEIQVKARVRALRKFPLGERAEIYGIIMLRRSNTKIIYYTKQMAKIATTFSTIGKKKHIYHIIYSSYSHITINIIVSIHL